MRTVLFVGGGSVGHIAPSVAVWEALQTIRKDATAHFVCSPRVTDAPYLRNLGLPYSTLDAPRIGFTLLWKYGGALRAAHAVLDRKKPSLVFSTGGYVSAPVIIAAWRRHIPVILLEPEALPGKTNRLLGRFAKKICKGIPIRACVTEGSRERGLSIAGLRGDRPVLLVMGGSQGAEAINAYVRSAKKELLRIVDIIHITGAGKLQSADAQKTSGYFATEFATEALPHFYAAANIAVSRAGASSIAELAANGIPSMLVPLHRAQCKNAQRAHDTDDSFTVCAQSEPRRRWIANIRSLLEKQHQRKKIHREQDSGHIAKIISQCLDSEAIPE